MNKGLKTRLSERTQVQGVPSVVVVVSQPLSPANRRLLESCLKGLSWRVGKPNPGDHVLVLGQKAHDLLSAIPYRSAEGHRWRNAT